jgi:hypothetical protein
LRRGIAAAALGQEVDVPIGPLQVEVRPAGLSVHLPRRGTYRTEPRAGGSEPGPGKLPDWGPF